MNTGPESECEDDRAQRLSVDREVLAEPGGDQRGPALANSRVATGNRGPVALVVGAEGGELYLQTRPLRLAYRPLGPRGERVKPLIEVECRIQCVLEVPRRTLVELVDHGDPHRDLAGEVGVDRAAGETGLLADLLE